MFILLNYHTLNFLPEYIQFLTCLGQKVKKLSSAASTVAQEVTLQTVMSEPHIPHCSTFNPTSC